MKFRVLLIALTLGGAALAAAPAGKPPAKKPEEPVAKIDGVTIARSAGFLGLRIVDNHFVLTFYDAEKKKIAPDAVRATLRWAVTYQKANEKAVLEPAGDGALSSSKFVRPPHIYKVFVTVFLSANEESVENYTVDYQD